MPYLVTTENLIGETKSLAVATLGEARQVVATITLPYALTVQPSEDEALSAACWAIPESGGTVGPLPDGRVIRVSTSPTQSSMRCDLRVWKSRLDTLRVDDAEIAAAWVDAFNARHS
jgi:hypothetical protein